MSDPGPVTEAVAAFVAELGELTGRRAVAASNAVRLARLLDGEESGSAASALSRELRLVVASLDATVTLPVHQPAVSAPREDAVARVRDEVARKRRQRASGA